jgi:NAD(P)-dependent dehydrogenase (short-subunit alcohol dehydrogenase family)
VDPHFTRGAHFAQVQLLKSCKHLTAACCACPWPYSDPLDPVLLERVMKRDAVFGGAIVAMSSTAGVRGGLAPAAFTASQHAVMGLTQQAAAELAPAGIRVNCVSPTILDTVLSALLCKLAVFLDSTHCKHHLITCLFGRRHQVANSRQAFT